MPNEIKFLNKVSTDIEKISESFSDFLSPTIFKSISWTDKYEATSLLKISSSDDEAKKLALSGQSYAFVFKDYITQLNRLLFYNLNLIVITGEQYYDHASSQEFNKIDSVINKKFIDSYSKLMKEVLSYIEKNPTVSNIDDIKNLAKYLQEKFDPSIIIKSIDKLKRLFRTVQQNVKFLSYQTFLYGSYQEVVELKEINDLYYLRKFDEETSSANPKDDYILLLINIKLAEIDDSLTCNENEIRELINLKNLLTRKDFRQKNSAYAQTEILIEKCIFLYKKVYERLKKENPKLIDDTDLELEPTLLQPNIVEFVYFKSFDDKLNLHKNIDTDSNYTIDSLNKTLHGAAPVITDFHHLVRLYRLKKVALSKFNELINLYDEKFFSVSTVTEFDRASYLVTKVFLLNCSFRRRVEIFEEKINELKRPEISTLIYLFDEIQINYEKIKNHCETNFRYNYYCHFLFVKATKIFIQSLNAFYSKQMSEIDENKILSLIEQFREAITLARYNLNWTCTHSIGAFYLPTSECISEVDLKDFKLSVDSDKITVFLDSSYVLPTNYDKFTNQLDILEDEFISNRAILLHKILSSKAKEIDKKGEEIEQSVNKSQRDYLGYTVQILTIFVAIIAFIFASLKVVPNLPDIKSVGVFLVSFATCLALFVLLLNFILLLFRTTKRGLFYETMVKLAFVLLVSLILLFTVVYSYNLIEKWGHQPFYNPIESDK